MKTRNTMFNKIIHLPSAALIMKLSTKRTLQMIIFSTLLLVSSTAFACEGQSRQRTEVLIGLFRGYVENWVAISQDIPIANFNPIESVQEMDRIYPQLPRSCQERFNQWLALYNQQIGTPRSQTQIFIDNIFR